MGIKVTRDGQIVDLLQGYEKVGTATRAITESKICFANETFDDDQVPDFLLERIKAGEHSGFAYFDGDEPPDAGSPEPDPQSAAGLGEKPPAGETDEPYDPSSHNAEEVLTYLKDADDGEVERVQAAEVAGHKRKGILDFKVKK